MESKVYIPQEPTKRDPATGELVPIMNLAPCSTYGEPVVCLPPGLIALTPAPTIFKLKECLRDFGEDDYIIAVGDPSLIAISAAIAADKNRGRFKLLKWDRDSRSYSVVQVDLHNRPGKEN